MKETINNSIKEALKTLGIEVRDFAIEYPELADHGDFSTNAALAHAKEAGMKPRELAEKIVAELEKQKIAQKNGEIEKIEIAGAGFINFYLSAAYFAEAISTILRTPASFGKNESLKNKKIMVEFTDPNLFKQFHIGHLMSNTIGEALSRIMEWSGADVTRACYQSDVGLNVAKAIWGMQQKEPDMPPESAMLVEKIAFVSESYVLGAKAYEDDITVKEEIAELNKLIYQKSPRISDLYNWGKNASLDHFDELYRTLGTKFDKNFFESQVAEDGIDIVESNPAIFEKSDGAIVFHGENYGLHTRVFITSHGLPTYETKELGLNTKKFAEQQLDQSIVITGNEQDDYFKVILKVLELIKPEIAKKMFHISHGMMRIASGKMSSRLGNVVTGETLIEDTRTAVFEKMKDRVMTADIKEAIATDVAVAAIKYSILKQAPGNNIVYDIKNSISFEGDSGPYLQYAHTRAVSLLEKAKQEGIRASVETVTHSSTRPSAQGIENTATAVAKLISRFPDIILRANENHAPQIIVTYLTELAGAFNSFYATTKIADPANKAAAYYVAITEAFAVVMNNGLTILGIRVPEKM